MHRSVPWWVRLYLAVGAIEAILIGASSWLDPASSLAHATLPLHVTPLNARVIGAFYLAGAIALLAALFTRSLAETRISVIGFGFIAGSLLIVTVVFWDEFTKVRVPYGWIASYIVEPVVAIIAVVALGMARPAISGFHRLTPICLAQAVAYGVPGLVLLLTPGFAVDRWPWKIDITLARSYACLFLAFALAGLLAAREAHLPALRPFAIASAALPILILIASLRHTDRFADGAREWLWFGGFAILAALLLLALFTVLRLPWRPTPVEVRPDAPLGLR